MCYSTVLWLQEFYNEFLAQAVHIKNTEMYQSNLTWLFLEYHVHAWQIYRPTLPISFCQFSYIVARIDNPDTCLACGANKMAQATTNEVFPEQELDNT